MSFTPLLLVMSVRCNVSVTVLVHWQRRIQSSHSSLHKADVIKSLIRWFMLWFLISGIIFVALRCTFSILSMSRLKCRARILLHIQDVDEPWISTSIDRISSLLRTWNCGQWTPILCRLFAVAIWGKTNFLFVFAIWGLCWWRFLELAVDQLSAAVFIVFVFNFSIAFWTVVAVQRPSRRLHRGRLFFTKLTVQRMGLHHHWPLVIENWFLL